jgi:CRP-like cAMP-binding protein
MVQASYNKKLDLESKALFLRRVPIFSAVDENNLFKIATITSEKHYSKKNIIFHEGDYGDALYIIKNGRVKIAKIYLDGREKTLTILKSGDFFGEMSIFDDLPRSATAEAMDNETILLSINRKDFERLVIENPSIALRIMKDLTKRIRQINEQVQDLAFKDVHGRVASAIYNLLKIEQESYKGNDKESINYLKITHQELANIVGSSRETVTRALNRLQDEGVISISHQQITVINKEDLLNY